MRSVISAVLPSQPRYAAAPPRDRSASPAEAESLRATILTGVAAVPRAEWDRLFPGEAEGWAYYRACETAPPEGFRFAAITVHRGAELIAAAPVFEMTYRLETPLQARWHTLSQWLNRTVSALVRLPVIGLGSPLADRLHLGFAPGLDTRTRSLAVAALLDGLERHAAERRISVLAIKDLANPDHTFAGPVLAAAGYTGVTSLPVAILDLPGASEQDYLASLSSSTRKELRRKLRDTGPVRIEHRTSIEGLEPQIYALYEETRRHSSLDYGDFEQLAPDWFGEVARGLGEQAHFVLCWLGDELVGFNLLLIERDRIIDKFIGLRYPQAREHNLYLVTWMENVRLCLARGVRHLQSGQTAYTMKVRLGSRLEPSWVYFKHRRRVPNLLFKRFGHRMAFDRLDPELQRLRSRGSEPSQQG